MRCRWKVCRNKRCGGLMNLDDMKKCVVQPPFKRERTGRPRCRMCNKAGHRKTISTSVKPFNINGDLV
ncbi:unnamed protein product, partial [Arabidopsis lyrata]